MDLLRRFTFGCCLLCSVAGAVRIFWPENSFKPVINSILMLYILTAGIQLLRQGDWNSMGAWLRGLSVEGTSFSETDYNGYRDTLALQTAVDAVREILEGAGIRASVSWTGKCCQIALVHAGDQAAAQMLLDQNLGELPYELTAGSAVP